MSTRLPKTGAILMESQRNWIMTVTPQDKVFYQQLGRRIAEQRKAQGLTQQQLAERLEISQQTLAHYEVGRLRVAVAMLSVIARELDTTVEALMGEQREREPGKRGPTPRLQRQLEQISQLPRSKQRFVMEMLDTVLQQTGS